MGVSLSLLPNGEPRAAARAAAAESVDWSSLAVELGFADQAHLTRAFTATVGTPPATYAKRAQAD